MTSEKNFLQIIDLSDIPSSMLLNSGTEIASYMNGNFRSVISVEGDVKIDYKGVVYDRPSEFPEIVKYLIKSEPELWPWADIDLNRQSSNRFVQRIYRTDDRGDENLLLCEAAEVENLPPEQLKEFMHKSIGQERASLFKTEYDFNASFMTSSGKEIQPCEIREILDFVKLQNGLRSLEFFAESNDLDLDEILAAVDEPENLCMDITDTYEGGLEEDAGAFEIGCVNSVLRENGIDPDDYEYDDKDSVEETK